MAVLLRSVVDGYSYRIHMKKSKIRYLTCARDYPKQVYILNHGTFEWILENNSVKESFLASHTELSPDEFQNFYEIEDLGKLDIILKKLILFFGTNKFWNELKTRNKL